MLYSLVSLVGLMAVGIVVAEALCRFAPKHASPAMPDNYLASLHGLRGFLALLVVVHACWAWFGYTSMSYWAAPSMIIENGGYTAAMLFFAISGFLYWEKLRGGAFDLRGFYRNRLRRLAPAYAALVAVLFVATFVRSGFQGRDFLTHAMPWLTLGLFGDFGRMNGMDVKIMHASALSALTTQMYFYLTLPFLAYFTRGHRVWALFAVAAAMVMMPNSVFASSFSHTLRDLSRMYWPTTGFAIGIFASYLLHQPKVSRMMKHVAAMPIALVAFAAAFYFGHPMWMGQPAPLVTAFALVFFTIVANGETFRGALTHRSLRFLGNISYSLFLFHGIVLYTMIQLMPAALKIDAQSWGRSFLVFAVLNAVVMGIAMLSHRFIEARFTSRRGRDNGYGNVVSLRKAA